MRPPEARAALARALARPGRPSADGDLNPGLDPWRLAPGAGLRPAAVLVGVDVSGAAARVLLTKRSAHLRHHPGQIALPGGKLEPGDGAGEAGAVAAALREAREEVGLDPGAAEVLGTYGPHATVTGFAITAVVALIQAPFVPVPQEEEVAEAFFVPLAHLGGPRNYRVEGRRWRGVRRDYHVLPFGPHYVWGATARVLYNLAERMA